MNHWLLRYSARKLLKTLLRNSGRSSLQKAKWDCTIKLDNTVHHCSVDLLLLFSFYLNDLPPSFQIEQWERVGISLSHFSISGIFNVMRPYLRPARRWQLRASRDGGRQSLRSDRQRRRPECGWSNRRKRAAKACVSLSLQWLLIVPWVIQWRLWIVVDDSVP